jgi:hypothetical protein
MAVFDAERIWEYTALVADARFQQIPLAAYPGNLAESSRFFLPRG